MQDDWKLGMVGLPYYIRSNPSGIDLYNFIVVTLSSEPDTELVQDL